MNHFSFELSLFALIPGLFLCGYVFYKDRAEQEPLGLLALLFGAGMIAYLPAFFAEKGIVALIDRLFASAMEFSPEGILTYASRGIALAHKGLCALFGFALVQVLLKWAVLFGITHKNKNFNYLFDGVVYSVFLALGFAVAENLVFALQNQGDMLIAKLLTSVPCHLFVGILMGYYYTMWRMRFLANRIENKLLSSGLIRKDTIRSSALWLMGSLAVPVLVCSLYGLAASISAQVVTVAFYVVVFVLYGLSFVAVNELAVRETSTGSFLSRVIAKGHPELTSRQIEDAVTADEDVHGEGGL